MRLKKVAVDALKGCQPLYIGASKLYHWMNPGFKPGNSGAPQAIHEALKKAKEMKGDKVGDYYGFGIFKGYTFYSAQKSCQQLRIDHNRFYGFDSFEGFPEIKGIDQANREFYKGQFAYPLEKAVENLDQNGFDWSRGVLIKGFYEDVLTDDLRKKHAFGKVGVAFLDCDLYYSTNEVLRWLKPYLTEGSIILFDDWMTYGDTPELGQQRSCREFLKANPEFGVEDLGAFQINGRAFLIHLKGNGRN